MKKGLEVLNTSVLIVGAGPSGLMLACCLAIHDVDFTIIDKTIEKPENSGALVIHAASLEILLSLGLLERVLTEATAVNAAQIKIETGKTHSFDLSGLTGTKHPYPAIILLEQFKLEEILRNFLFSKGKNILSGYSLEKINTNSEFISSEVHYEGSSHTVINSRFVVGADGKSSRVRELLDIPYRRHRHKEPIFIMDYAGDAPAQAGNIYFSFTRQGSFGLFPLKGGYFRLDGSLPGLKSMGNQISFADIKGSLPDNVRIANLKWFSIFYGNYLLCDSFNSGNIFLIGDAAHTHNPVGGQGMNSGFQDAVNLGWKLSYVIKGLISQDILKTYTIERRPAVRKIMQRTSFFFTNLTNYNYVSVRLRVSSIPLILQIGRYLYRSDYLKLKLFRGISQLWINYDSLLTIPSSYHRGYKAGSLFYQSDLPPDIYNTINYKLLIFSKKPLYTNHPELSTFPLDIITTVESKNNAALFERMQIRNMICILLRPDNYIAMVSNKLQIKQIVSYFKDIG